jgi:hypothetical protein
MSVEGVHKNQWNVAVIFTVDVLKKEKKGEHTAVFSFLFRFP